MKTKLPKGEHKKQVSIYIEEDFIEEVGGKKVLQDFIRKWVYALIDHIMRLDDTIK